MTIQTLLPKARIDMFTHDPATEGTLRTLCEDWRFARIEAAYHAGSVDAALAAYQETVSPDLLIIQTKDIGAEFAASLEKLSEHCAAHTSCLVIAPVNDVPLYRKLMQMGISDYLVAPTAQEDLLEAIAKILLDKHGYQETQIISILGSKGGSGASSLAQLLAEGLSHKAQQKTLLMDAAGAWTDLPVWLGYEPSVSLKDLALAAKEKDKEAIERVVLSLTDKLSVVATGAEKLFGSHIRADDFELILNQLLPGYPYVVVDLSSSPRSMQEMMLKRSTRIIVASEASIGALRIARSLLEEVQHLRGDSQGDLDIVLTKRGLNKGQDVPLSDIKAALNKEPVWEFPWSEKLMAARDMRDKRFVEEEEGQVLAAGFVHAIFPELYAEPEQHKSLMEMLGLKKSA